MATRAKRMVSRFGSGMAARLAIFLLLLVGLRVLHHQPVVFGDIATTDRLTLALLGLVLFAAGLGLAIWARVYIAENWGMPMSVKADPELVTTGPYSYIRHPIYTGVLLAALATVLVAGFYWLLIALFMGVYFVYSAKQEEKYLLRTFPKAYPKYMHTTKMLIPFVF